MPSILDRIRGKKKDKTNNLVVAPTPSIVPVATHNTSMPSVMLQKILSTYNHYRKLDTDLQRDIRFMKFANGRFNANDLLPENTEIANLEFLNTTEVLNITIETLTNYLLDNKAKDETAKELDAIDTKKILEDINAYHKRLERIRAFTDNFRVTKDEKEAKIDFNRFFTFDTSQADLAIKYLISEDSYTENLIPNVVNNLTSKTIQLPLSVCQRLESNDLYDIKKNAERVSIKKILDKLLTAINNQIKALSDLVPRTNNSTNLSDMMSSNPAEHKSSTTNTHHDLEAENKDNAKFNALVGAVKKKIQTYEDESAKRWTFFRTDKRVRSRLRETSIGQIQKAIELINKPDSSNNYSEYLQSKIKGGLNPYTKQVLTPEGKYTTFVSVLNSEMLKNQQDHENSLPKIPCLFSFIKKMFKSRLVVAYKEAIAEVEVSNSRQNRI